MAIITDPIADMFVRINNARARKMRDVIIPHSLKKVAILDIFKREGYIVDFKEMMQNNHKHIVVSLKYKGFTGSQSVINGLKKVSKPGLKVYAGVKSLPKVLSGYGTAIISTSKGLLTDKEARKENVGGEVIAFIW
ncbi:30S ribosomal protein S8 [Mycoplasma miroungirhinis]|uniref:Small ribosomal subunit protein uS8 n=1 Tax=Mycoplasma miroungirhinis TaxID=754516 RepID=A0A6M4JD27_9MOLU|nr:30S ribosomal protein S8 [Mycoplasma miroungirhinis]QJR43979.1 30S ribosomal protein S8 [Mycoplasma miroungirhinis]